MCRLCDDGRSAQFGFCGILRIRQRTRNIKIHGCGGDGYVGFLVQDVNYAIPVYRGCFYTRL
jgi:hypothetical protein